MTIRITNPALDNTEKLLEQVLLAVIRDGDRVLFLCDSGTGPAVVQRLRMMISRNRKSIAAKGGRVKRFRLRSTYHPETHSGKRYDACVLWKDSGETHKMRETLEGILSNG